MNITFVIMCVSSIILLLFTEPSGVLSAMLGGAQNAIGLAVKLLSVYSVWLGVMQVMGKCGFNNVLSRIFRPITRKLFKGESKNTQDLISLNLATNFLGIGGVATPLGIKAVSNMQSASAGARERLTNNATLFIVINACGVQLLPATIVSLRQSAGSANSADIILPTIISTVLTATIGVVLCFITNKRNG